MSSGHAGQPPYSQPPYPGVSFPPLQPAEPPPRPGKSWPLGAVNRWMSIGVTAITLLAALLAVVASRTVSGPPSNTGMRLAYQSSLARNDTGPMRWNEGERCQFTSTGYVVTAPDAQHGIGCRLEGSFYQDFTLQVRVLDANQAALIGFHRGEQLAIFGSGRFLFYQPDPRTGQALYLPGTGTSAGSAALHPTSLGIRERANEITVQVLGLSYSFYANGQLLATYTSPALAKPGPIILGAGAGSQAVFSDIAIYTPR